MAERKFNFSLSGNKDTNIGSPSDELRKIEAKKAFNYQVVPIDKIQPNPMNDYPMEDIEELNETIAKVGLIHILKLKQIEEGFRIISGERRYRAIKLGLENGQPEFDKFKIGIPAMIEDKTTDEIQEEIQLILANEEVRGNDEARKRKKIARLAELYRIKNEQTGENHSITKQISTDLGLKERQVQRYNAVNNKLIPTLQDALDNSKINLSKAAQFAAMDETTQNLIAELLDQNNNVNKEQVDLIIQKAKDAELKMNQRLSDLELQINQANESNNKLKEEVERRELDLQSQKELEEKIRNDLKRELEQTKPNDDKVKTLELQLEATYKKNQDTQKNVDKINSELKEKVEELEALKTKLEENQKTTLTQEEKLKLKKDFEINNLMMNIQTQLEQLTALNKNYKKQFNISISGISEFCKKTIEKVHEIKTNN